ncbi:hypothetical protein EVAR_89562_1 [Eumeta japonica]|uniref:Uncharacterized protein n=1 Tax=Eumeta variegata TaxID=151549 RepID=A0A4C1YTF4_EUMVA|nr:hypothetical protein EVAR_89562_1 [Eumeta japonica]
MTVKRWPIKPPSPRVDSSGDDRKALFIQCQVNNIRPRVAFSGETMLYYNKFKQQPFRASQGYQNAVRLISASETTLEGRTIYPIVSGASLAPAGTRDDAPCRSAAAPTTPAVGRGFVSASVRFLSPSRRRL